MDIYAVVGAGGFGREVIPLAEQMLRARLKANTYRLVFVAEDPTESIVNGYPVISLDEFIGSKAERKFYIIAIGDSSVRYRISSRLLDFSPFSIYAPTHRVLDNNAIGEGGIFCDYTVITSNSCIGRHFHANIYSYVAHDCTIGDFVTFAPGVKCNGNVVIEDHAYIGTGVVIKQGSYDNKIIIGRGAVIGMGSVVTKSVEANTVAFGSPAKFVKKLSP